MIVMMMSNTIVMIMAIFAGVVRIIANAHLMREKTRNVITLQGLALFLNVTKTKNVTPIKSRFAPITTALVVPMNRNAKHSKRDPFAR